MFFEMKKAKGPAQGLLAIKVDAAKKKIATIPHKPKKQAKPKRD
ncbi:hypothetical protein J2W32_000958 [Variovorax boronicumulans]|uniref:Uncharacterized protein n=1 Tax=Variovorax boronicumulans TaxID=436515 RepID=A0AAW8CVN6_9BURK|nr:hypothetical protein [Variovorax boronicumulans]MDP9892598.1 hypothetical protein [Variovorax boronicumulans]MDQ0051922.1 hypothetical protein [Variovorax boronicumulans]